MSSSVDSPDNMLETLPVCNYFIMMLISLCFVFQIIFDPDVHFLNVLVLKNWSLSGILGYSWLQSNTGHLGDNLLALMIFGRHVSLKMSKRVYFSSYIIFGIVAAAVHLLFDGRPAVGASGAIMGILGLHMVICYKKFGKAGPWLIIVWIFLTVAAGVNNTTTIAYMEHFGGFLCGMFIGVFLIYLNATNCDDTDPGLLRLISRLRPCTVAA